MTTWTRFATSGASAASEDVRTALAGLGSEPEPTEPSPSDVGLVVFDTVSPGVIELVSDFSQEGAVRVLAIGTTPSALDDRGPWPILDAGASDVLIHTETDDLANEVFARLSRWKEIEALVQGPLVQEALAGRTPAWISLLRQIVEVGSFSDTSILLVGEIGTGKDAVARLIHELDPRPLKGKLVVLDPPALDPALSETELLGHVSEAMEGAVGGTLFVNEIGVLPATLQSALLRPNDDRSNRRVGGGDARNLQFRLICSTSDDTDAAGSASAGNDVSQRMNAWRCRLLPLREHREDIPMIAERLLRRLRQDLESVRLDPALATFLANQDYPANVHDLLTLVQGISVRHVGPGPVTVGAIPPDVRLRLAGVDHSWRGTDLVRAIGRAVDAGASLKTIGEEARATAVRIVLTREEGDARRAARRLGTSARTIVSRTPSLEPERATETDAGGHAPVVEVPETALLGGRAEGGAEDPIR